MKNVSFQLLLLVSLLAPVFLEGGRTMDSTVAVDTSRIEVNYYERPCNPSKDPNCVTPCNPENPNCSKKQGAMDTNRANVIYYERPCNPSKDPNCVKPCNPENPNCRKK